MMKDMKNTANGDRGECNEDSSSGLLRADPGLDHCLELSVKCELHLAAVRWLVTGVRLRRATHIHTTAQQPVKLRGRASSLLMDTTSWDNIVSTHLKGIDNKEMCKINSAVPNVYPSFGPQLDDAAHPTLTCLPSRYLGNEKILMTSFISPA